MVIQSAKRLGLLHIRLKIPADSRISYQLTREGIDVWDWTNGIKYVVTQNPSVVTVHHFQTPQQIRAVLTATDADLKKRWDDGIGWDDEREAIFSELCERGVNMLP